MLVHSLEGDAFAIHGLEARTHQVGRDLPSRAATGALLQYESELNPIDFASLFRSSETETTRGKLGPFSFAGANNAVASNHRIRAAAPGERVSAGALTQPRLSHCLRFVSQERTP